MYAPQATLSLQQKLQRQLMELPQILDLLRQSPDLSLDCIDDPLTQRFFRHFPQTYALPPVVPLLLWQGCYYIASPTTLTPEKTEQMEQRTQTRIEVLPISLRVYKTWLQRQKLRGQTPRGTQDQGSDRASTEDVRDLTEKILATADQTQVEKIKTLIRGALQTGASDIHLEPVADGLRVRYRIDGVLRPHVTFGASEGRRLVAALKVMCEMDIAERRAPQDGRLSDRYTQGQNGVEGLDLRVSTLPCLNGRGQEEKVVLRLLRQNNSFQTLADIGFTPQALQFYESWVKQPHGLIIFAGPTGSGKTSTLYTTLRTIAQDTINVTTVENPVEYLLPGITQTQVHEAAGMSFAAGLRAILRQDPDVIMVGETRDEETAKIVIQAALTGHLVFTTLHANDALGSIPRLRDIGRDPGLLSDALLGVVAQRLVRRICSHCSHPHQPTPPEVKILGLTLEEVSQGNWRKGAGCSHCFNSGYMGREAVIELLHIDDQTRQLIYDGNIVTLAKSIDPASYQSFAQAARLKVLQGLTTTEEVERVLGRRFLNDRPDRPHQS